MSKKPDFLMRKCPLDYVQKNIIAKFDGEQSTFLHSTPLNKIVLEWAIYSIETIKYRIG